MSNVNTTDKTRNKLVAALTVTPQSVCPIALGEVGWWLDSGDSLLKKRNADGTDVALGDKNNVLDQVRLLDASVFTIGGGGDYVYSATAKTLTAKANGALGTIDSVAPAVGDRFVRNIGDAQDGIYVITSLGATGAKAVVTRAGDLNATADFVDASLVVVALGTTYGGKLFELGVPAGFVLDTNTPTWTQTASGVTFAGVKAALAAANSSVGLNGQALTNLASAAIYNAAKTFLSTITSLATQARAVVLPDGAGTVLLDAVAASISAKLTFAAGMLGLLKEVDHTIKPDDSTTTNANGAALTLDTGAKDGAGVNVNLTLGATNALKVLIGRAAGYVGFFGSAGATKPTAYTQTYATADKTVAAVTSNTITDNSGSTPSTTELAAQSVTMTGVDGVGNNAASKADVDAVLAVIRNNIGTLKAELTLVKADLLLAKKNDNALIDDLQAVGLVG